MSSRGKGRDNENKAADITGGVRISEAGKEGADVLDGAGNLVEVKYRKKLWADLESWMEQRDAQGCDYLVIRRAYGKFQVVMDYEHFRDKYLGITEEGEPIEDGFFMTVIRPDGTRERWRQVE